MASHNILSKISDKEQSLSPRGHTLSKAKNMKPASALKAWGVDADRHIQDVHGPGKDHRRARVSKACERCRLKKIKGFAQCDGELPCQKCKNNGHVCTPGVRKRTIHVEYKQVPKSYVDFLETTHLALIGSVHKLYSMIQKNQPWDLGAPELNDQGELVIHDIAKKLGCIGPNGEIELPIQYELPSTPAGMARLAAHPERQQYQDEDEDTEHNEYKEVDSHMKNHTDEPSPSSSEPLPSIETELDYRKEAFSGYNNSITHSPQSLYSIDDSEQNYSGSEYTNSCVTSSPYVSSIADYSSSSLSQLGAAPNDLTLFLQQYGQTPDMGTMNWELGESGYDGTKNTTMPDFEITMNMENQMVLPDYNDHSVWLSQTLSGWKDDNQVPMEV
ncbi:c6 transcription factor [Trichoderma arundinaceum]|uniref:C6 transcription factor n=1 Tax=Trichoderma arundinaceum TaxID=490622 RepID=A0A395NLD2_TRIAR|nr:c6 transcription factor [Trichoderma arundinaceum]